MYSLFNIQNLFSGGGAVKVAAFLSIGAEPVCAWQKWHQRRVERDNDDDDDGAYKAEITSTDRKRETFPASTGEAPTNVRLKHLGRVFSYAYGTYVYAYIGIYV